MSSRYLQGVVTDAIHEWKSGDFAELTDYGASLILNHIIAEVPDDKFQVQIRSKSYADVSPRDVADFLHYYEGE